MKRGWELVKLGSICKIQLGKTPFRHNIKYWDVDKKSENVWISISDMVHGEHIYDSKEYVSDLGAKMIAKIPIGTLLLSFKLTIGRVSFAGKDLFTNEAIASILDLSRKVDKTYLFYYFSFFNWDLVSAGDIKVKGKTLNKKKLNDLDIILPPLPEQQRIVSILDEAFLAIDRAKSNAEQNLKNAKELFESYLQGVFENANWETKRIDEICTLINGRAYNKQELLSEGKYTVLRVGNFFTNNNWYYSDLELPEDKYCEEGDLLYAWSASFGPRIWKGEKVIYHYHIWKVVPNLNLVSKEFLFILFEWDKEKIKATQGTGTTMMHVSKGSMEERIIPLPPLKEQETIIRQLDALRAETQKLEAVYQKKLDDLEELKKSILQKAFTGELTEEDTAI